MNDFNSSETPNSSDTIIRQDAINEIRKCRFVVDAIEKIRALPSAQAKKQASDEIYGMMKDYYFKHRNDHDASWQGGFAKCMNLIPNMYERREDG